MDASMRTLILSFDMETDLGSWSRATRGITAGTPEILRLLRSHRVPATFFYVGREAQAHPASVRQVLADGHEIGCHTMYHETVGQPVYDVPVGGFILDAEIGPRLELATAAVEQVAGVRPVSFRAPRLFGSAALLCALDRLGYVADSSFPAYFHGRDFRPYHPARGDWTRDGDLAILEIPPFFDADAMDGGEQNRERDQWPRLRLKGSDWFTDLARRMFKHVEAQGAAAPLCVYLHPWEFVPMPRDVHTDESTIALKPFLYENTGTPALRALDEFLGAMRDDGVRFVTMRDYAAEIILHPPCYQRSACLEPTAIMPWPQAASFIRRPDAGHRRDDSTVDPGQK
jgi:peptidoglycan-N-acetylglucosamine deacetylase